MTTIMVTKNAKKRLELTPVTIYLTPEDHAWLKAHAEEVARQDGEPTSMTKVVRRAVVQYREKIERK
jgi:hypothetical protein